MEQVKTQAWRHVGFALLLTLALAGVRYAASSSDGLDKIEQFEMSSGTDVGPDVAFFGAGLHGDAAIFTIIGLDPLGGDLGQRLNEPAYRYQRFGYSWTALGLTGGADGLILLGLSLIGLASAAGMAYLASTLNEPLGWRSWLLIANPAVLLGVINDTAEPLALLMMILALSATVPLLRVASGVAVAVVRPSYLVALFGRWWVFVPALVVAVAAKVAWSLRFGDSVLSGSIAVDLPFLGILENPSLLGWLVTLAGLATALVGAWKRDWGWVAGGLFVLAFSAGVFHTPTNAVRAAGYLPVLWAFGPNWKPSRAATQASHVVDDH